MKFSNTLAMRASLALVVAIPALLANPPISTTVTVNLNPNPVTVSTLVTVTGNITAADSSAVTGGNLYLVAVRDLAGNSFGCSLVGTISPIDGSTIAYTGPGSVADVTPAAGVQSVTYQFTPTSAGTYGFGVHYVPSGGSGYHEAAFSCTDLVVTAGACTGGFQIAATQASGTNTPAAGLTWSGSFVITVSNCGTDILSGVTAQGGTSAWTSTVSYSSPDGPVGLRKATGGGNQILLWNIGTMQPGQVANLTVNLTGKIKAGTPVGTVLNINGGWSAAATDTVSLLKLTAGYTDPIIITVQ